MKTALVSFGILLLSSMGFSQQMTEILGRPTNNSITVSVLFDSSVDVYFEYGTAQGSYSLSTIISTCSAGEPTEINLTGLQSGTRYYYRTRYRKTGTSTYLASDEHTFVTQRKKGSTFRFIIEADPHPYDKKGCWNLWNIALANQLKDTADFMLDLGDTFGDDHNPFTITNQEEKQLHFNCRSFFGKACHSLPLYLCIGNHEGESGYYLLQTPPNNLATYATLWRKYYYPNPFPDGFYSGNIAEEASGIGKPENYYAWEWGDALFIVLDAYRYYTANAKPRNWDWTIGKTQYDWFKQTLENSTAKHKFVFAHHVLGETRGGVGVASLCEWGDVANFEANRPGWGGVPLHQLMVNSKVDIFFQGHDHIYAREEKDGLIYQTVPMPSDSTYIIGMRDNGDAFTGVKLAGAGHLRVTVSSDNVTVDYISAVLPADETATSKNGEIVYSYNSIGITSVNNSTDFYSENKPNWTLFPNPAADYVNISLNQPTDKDLLVQIINIDGKVVRQVAISGRTINLKLNDNAGHRLSTGVYLVKLFAGGNYVSCKKMVVKSF
ncbi:MAG: metallophosphoesterase [Bacteroidales bacterium]|nr:metallophosphoesterase [Bacteroidales bacterium]